MTKLAGFKVAVIATDGFEESELTETVKALRKEGATVEVLSPKTGEIQAFRHFEKGQKIAVDRLLESASPSEFDALLLPGGAVNADQLRADAGVKKFVKEISAEGKPIASICHAPWILVSCDLVKGRTMTSYRTIEDDLRNAGAKWVNESVVVDDTWVTSRQPSDIPAFNRAMIDLFARSGSSIIQIAESA